MAKARNLSTLLAADGQVESDKIDSVDSSKLTGTVSVSRLAAGSIDSAHVAAGAVDDAHISGLAATKLTGTVASARLGSGTASSTTFLRGDNAWATVESLPSQTGNNGKHLITNGSTASWSTVANLFPFYKTNGSADNITISADGEFPFYKTDGTQDNIDIQ